MKFGVIGVVFIKDEAEVVSRVRSVERGVVYFVKLLFNHKEYIFSLGGNVSYQTCSYLNMLLSFYQ